MQTKNHNLEVTIDRITPIEGTNLAVDEFAAYFVFPEGKPHAEALNRAVKACRVVIHDGMGQLPGEWQGVLPSTQDIADQAVAILRGLRAKSAEEAETLANEIMGY